MKILIAGGGTGGHLFPGIAMAEEIMRRDETAKVIFIGTEHGIESSIVPREGFPLRLLRAEGFAGKNLITKVRAMVKAVLSMSDAYRILKTEQPDGLIGLGSYASVGPVLAGSLLSVPTIITEQNSVPGLANKVLCRFADMICVTYYESISFFPREKTFLTGNPIRKGILQANKDIAYQLFGLERDKFTILVSGGSQGAQRINSAVSGAFNYLTDLREKVQFLHQTGARDVEAIRQSYRKWGFRGTVAGFIHQMPEAYAAADLVVSRAGATTLAEITAVGKPSILIPYPFAAAHHQEINARRLSEMGAARVIFDHDLDGEILAKNLRDIYSNDRLRLEMQQASRSLGKPHAAEKVIDMLLSLMGGKERRGLRIGGTGRG